MTLYNTIGHGYAKTRLADDRIASQLTALLDLPAGSSVLDVGAGTGKYARALADRGYALIALEPSEVMQAQATAHPGVHWVRASAESIPLPDHAVAGVIVVLAVHHFADRGAAFREMVRVAGRGPIVVLTFDPSVFRQIWLARYFPEIGRRFRGSAEELSHTAEELERATSRRSHVIPFPLPPDLGDRFGASYWSCPEAYLDPDVRNGISDFALMAPSAVAQGLRDLEEDLRAGRWDAEYGALRSQASYDAGYQFIVSRNP